MRPTERLAKACTPDGADLELLRHDGAYFIRVNGIELMSTRRHLSEDRLAEVACADLGKARGARVLVGGLGLGFTLRAALAALAADAEVVVAELVPDVIAWNARDGFGISAGAMEDPRTRIVAGDVSDVLAANVGGFDAIMLDTDNGPDGMLISENARLYAAKGVARTVAALKPGGVIVYWSVGDDHRFLDLLQRSGLRVETQRVRAHGTAGPMHVLYVARPRDPGPRSR